MRGGLPVGLAAVLGASLVTLSGDLHAEGACLLRSESVDLGRVTVAPRSVPAFDVIARDVAVVATIGAAGAAKVHVRGSLAFDGVARDLHLRLGDLGLLASPPLWLRPGVPLVRPRRSAGSRVLVDIPLARGVVALGRAYDCGSLELAPAPSPSADPSPLPEFAVEFAAAEVLEVWSGPGEGTKVTLGVPNPFDLPLSVRPGREGFVEVEASLPRGRVSGFVAPGSLTKTPQPVGRSEGFTRGACGCMGPSRQWARIAAGTRVFARPGRHPWARVPSETFGVVSEARTAGYAQLYLLPDLQGTGSHDLIEQAWVPVGALSGPRRTIP